MIPPGISGLAAHLMDHDMYALDPGTAGDVIIQSLFADESAYRGILAGLCLLIWGMLGSLVTAARVRREMIP
jgi:hypothetical protein